MKINSPKRIFNVMKMSMPHTHVSYTVVKERMKKKKIKNLKAIELEQNICKHGLLFSCFLSIFLSAVGVTTKQRWTQRKTESRSLHPALAK